jgi:hypothetical protein
VGAPHLVEEGFVAGARVDHGTIVQRSPRAMPNS